MTTLVRYSIPLMYKTIYLEKKTTMMYIQGVLIDTIYFIWNKTNLKLHSFTFSICRNWNRLRFLHLIDTTQTSCEYRFKEVYLWSVNTWTVMDKYFKVTIRFSGREEDPTFPFQVSCNKKIGRILKKGIWIVSAFIVYLNIFLMKKWSMPISPSNLYISFVVFKYITQTTGFHWMKTVPFVEQVSKSISIIIHCFML